MQTEVPEPIPVGARVWVSDVYYTGAAVVLEYDPTRTPYAVRPGETPGPYYCHLLDKCDHEWCEPADDCFGEDCRGWYQIIPEAQDGWER